MTHFPPYAKRKQSHAIYRVFDADGSLLYVGCSLSPLQRVFSHCNRKPWRKLIANVSVEWLPDWKAAREAEAKAIATENPIWNVHHKPNERIKAVGIFSHQYDEDDPKTWIVRVSA